MGEDALFEFIGLGEAHVGSFGELSDVTAVQHGGYIGYIC